MGGRSLCSCSFLVKEFIGAWEQGLLEYESWGSWGTRVSPLPIVNGPGLLGDKSVPPPYREWAGVVGGQECPGSLLVALGSSKPVAEASIEA